MNKTYPQACERVLTGSHESGRHDRAHVPPATFEAVRKSQEFAHAVRTRRDATGAWSAGSPWPSWGGLSDCTIDILSQGRPCNDSSMTGHDCLPDQVRGECCAGVAAGGA